MWLKRIGTALHLLRCFTTSGWLGNEKLSKKVKASMALAALVLTAFVGLGGNANAATIVSSARSTAIEDGGIGFPQPSPPYHCVKTWWGATICTL